MALSSRPATAGRIQAVADIMKRGGLPRHAEGAPRPPSLWDHILASGSGHTPQERGLMLLAHTGAASAPAALSPEHAAAVGIVGHLAAQGLIHPVAAAALAHPALGLAVHPAIGPRAVAVSPAIGLHHSLAPIGDGSSMVPGGVGDLLRSLKGRAPAQPSNLSATP